MTHDCPVTEGHQYSTVAKERQGEGFPFHVHAPTENIDAKLDESASPGVSREAHAHKFSGDSTLATPGHGAPIPAPKAPNTVSPGDDMDATTPVKANGSTNGTASPGKGPGGKQDNVQVAGAPQGMKEVKDAARAELKATPKKHGFFRKLKGGLRALGGRHDGEDTK